MNKMNRMNKVQKNVIEKYLINVTAIIDKKTNKRWNILCDYILLGYNYTIYNGIKISSVKTIKSNQSQLK